MNENVATAKDYISSVPGAVAKRAASEGANRESVSAPVRPQAARITETREQIFAAGMAEFSERGFRGATIANIAQRASVSRMTVYKYVESKEQLLEMLSDYYSNRLRSSLGAVIDDARPCWEVLMAIGHSLYADGRYADSRAIARVLVIEAEQLPHLAMKGLALRETVLEPLADYLGRLSLAGKLAIDNPQFAAQQFLNLTTNSVDYLFGGKDVQEGEREKYIAAAVKTFLYGVNVRRDNGTNGLSQ